MKFSIPLRPALLVSVRDPAEALSALAGGADVIDIKEPARGPLGRANLDTIRSISEAVRGFRADGGRLTAALGELPELPDVEELLKIAACTDAVKVGLSQCHATDWQTGWRMLSDELAQASATPLIAVVYADWESCGAPAPRAVIETATASSSPGVLFDTFHKRGRRLLDELSLEFLRETVAELHASQRFAALAGNLDLPSLETIADLRPEIIAVRSAVCCGGRNGAVDADLVASFRAAMRSSCPLAPEALVSTQVRKG